MLIITIGLFEIGTENFFYCFFQITYKRVLQYGAILTLLTI